MDAARSMLDEASPPGSRTGRWGVAARYLVGAGAVLAAFALKLAFARYLGPPYLLFYPTVMAVALLAGPGPGLLAVALRPSSPSAGSSRRSPRRPGSGELISLAIFALSGLLMCLVAHLYRRARERAAGWSAPAPSRRARPGCAPCSSRPPWGWPSWRPPPGATSR